MAKNQTGGDKPAKTKTSSAKKSADIKPAAPADVVDQETQVTKVQEVTDEQQSQTPVEPETVLIDKGIEPPVEEGPVVNEKAEGTIVNYDDIYPRDENGVPKEPEFDEKAEKKLADHSLETREPTRYGHGKEKAYDDVEEPGISRHYTPPLHGNPTGGTNEYPR